jgi:hypothetical protein
MENTLNKRRVKNRAGRRKLFPLLQVSKRRKAILNTERSVKLKWRCGKQSLLEGNFVRRQLQRRRVFCFLGHSFHQQAVATALERRLCFVDAKVFGDVIPVPPEFEQHHPFAKCLGGQLRKSRSQRRGISFRTQMSFVNS